MGIELVVVRTRRIIVMITEGMVRNRPDASNDKNNNHNSSNSNSNNINSVLKTNK